MNALLIPLKPEPDPHAEHFCEACSEEITDCEPAQCPRCEMDFHPSCWWDDGYDLCRDCLLLDYARLDTMRRRLGRWEEVVREELVERREADALLGASWTDDNRP